MTTAFLSFEPGAEIYQEQPILYSIKVRYQHVALTFDDCYLVKMLHRLEEVLEENVDVRITLFPVGEALINNESKDPGVWKRFYDQGHEFGYHSYDHANPAMLSPQEVLDDYDRWLEALFAVLGEIPPVHFARPPFGNASSSFLYMCSQRGLVPTMWSTGWGGPTESIIKYTVPKIEPGDIVLLHTRPEDMETTKKALPELAKRGIQALTMTHLYMEWLKEAFESNGCYADVNSALRTCIE